MIHMASLLVLLGSVTFVFIAAEEAMDTDLGREERQLAATAGVFFGLCAWVALSHLLYLIQR